MTTETCILQETASKRGNLYHMRYYLDGRRIPNSEAHRLFNLFEPKLKSSERVSSIAGWRSTWEIPA